MNQLLELLQGLKTHFTCAIIIGLLLLQWMGLVHIPPEVYGSLVVLALMFFRAGVSREVGLVMDAQGAAGTAAPQPSAPAPKASGPNGAILSLLIFWAVAMGVLVGCKGTLEPGGAYAPVGTNAVTGIVQTNSDMTLFLIDSAYKLAWSTMTAAFDTEAENRALLYKLSPEIKRSLDQIRPLAKDADRRFHRARSDYISNPIPENMDALHAILSELERLSTSAQAALPQFENPKGN